MMSSITHLKGGRVIDPVNNTDEIKDLFFMDGIIIKTPEKNLESKVKEVNVEGKIVFPGLVDLRTHLRNVSGGQAENIKTVTAAAPAGG